MGKELMRSIEAWFAAHDGDGEFTSGPRAFPYSVIGSPSRAARFIFTTKPAVVSRRIDEQRASLAFGMIGRYGLPCEEDLHWIHEVVGPRPLLFLGDMDPIDLMVFAWLRASLYPKVITHLGVNDALLGVLDMELPESSAIPCAPSEQESFTFLKEVFPDLSETVGRQCASLLEAGRKIELEATVSAYGEASAILSAAKLVS